MSKKVTKPELVAMMKESLNSKTIAQAGKDMIKYVLGQVDKDYKSVTLADLKETFDTAKTLLDAPVKVAVENQVKPKVVKGAKKPVSVDEGAEQISAILDEAVENQPVALAKKGTNKKPTPAKTTKKEDTKEPVVEHKAEPSNKVEHTNNKTTKKATKEEAPNLKAVEILATMPELMDSKLGKLKKRADIKSIQELSERIEDNEDLVLCTYWTARHLRQFDYDPLGIQEKPMKSFPNDLDIIEILYASPNGAVAYGISVYTEVNTIITADGFETDEETGLRYSFGLEYQIYEILPKETK